MLRLLIVLLVLLLWALLMLMLLWLRQILPAPFQCEPPFLIRRE
jgi:hypothetical protein